MSGKISKNFFFFWRTHDTPTQSHIFNPFLLSMKCFLFFFFRLFAENTEHTFLLSSHCSTLPTHKHTHTQFTGKETNSIYVLVRPQFALKWAVHNFSQSQTVLNCCLRITTIIRNDIQYQYIHSHWYELCAHVQAAQSRSYKVDMLPVLCSMWSVYTHTVYMSVRVCIFWVVRWYKERCTVVEPNESHVLHYVLYRAVWTLPVCTCIGMCMCSAYGCIVASESNSRPYVQVKFYTL